MKQQSLFGNLPKLNDRMKDINKEIIQKANQPKQQKTYTARGGGGGKAMQARVAAIVDTARQKLIDDGTMELITDEVKFRHYMGKIRKKGIASLDTETTGLDPIKDKLVGMSLYAKGLKPAYIPVWHTDFGDKASELNIPTEIVKEEIQKCIDEQTGFIFHNAKFDMRVVRNGLGMNGYIKCIWDTAVAGKLLNENEPNGLKYLWNSYVNKNAQDDAETFDKLFEKVPFNYIPMNIGYIYAAHDALMTYELYEFQKRFLDIHSKECRERDLLGAAQVLNEIEIPLIKYLCEMEDQGVSIDKEVATNLSKKYNKLLEDAEKAVQEEIGKIDLSGLGIEQRSKLTNPVNSNSPQQLAIILYDALGLKSTDRRKPRGTGEDILEGLKEKNPQYVKLFDGILEYRGIKKLLSTYIDKIPRLEKEETGKVHTEFKQYGAVTGRFSSADPNLQNIPSKNKEIRKMFIPSDGYVLIGADYSQQEPRVLAHLCMALFKDAKMMDAYIEGRDLYAWMASEIYSTPYEECKEFYPNGEKNPEGKKKRDAVKSIILGLMYGRGTASIAEQIGRSVSETEKIVGIFFKSFPAIKQVIEYWKQHVMKYGFVQTVYGRKRRLPEMNLPEYEFVNSKDRTQVIEDPNITRYYWNKMQGAWGHQKREVMQDANSRGIWIIDNGAKIADAERQILNSVVQGSSADITKKAMIEVGKNEELRELGYRMLLTVHDELIGEAPKATAKQCGEIVCRIMMDVTKDKVLVPMKVDAEYTDRWYGEDISSKIGG